MTHVPVLPILIPLFTAAALVFFYRLSVPWQRVLSLGSALLLLVASLWLTQEVRAADYLLYTLGDWPPPFGIVLVADRLSALLLVLTAALALISLLYASRGDDAQGAHFHALIQFQLAGIAGAFLTGDLFNLFVFFEMLLIASYALLLHGAGTARSRAALHYVIINLVGSVLFIVAIGLLYGVTGSLNMADVAQRIPQLSGDDALLARSAGMLLIVVFGVKAALLPMLFWLPRAYSAASAPVAALFAIMTKVGIYAMLRLFTLVFSGDDADLIWQWIWPLALATLALGGIGVLGANSLRSLTAYMVIVSAGTLLATLSLRTEAAIAAGLYYLIHSTLMTAAFFLFADLIARQRGDAADYLVVTAAMKHRRTLGMLYFASAVAFAGLPPFSGFVSKLWILQVSGQTPSQGWLWSLLLLAGFLILVALSRAGSKFFWRQSGDRPHPWRADPIRLSSVVLILMSTVLLAVFAQPMMDAMTATARSLLDTDGYLEAVNARMMTIDGGD